MRTLERQLGALCRAVAVKLAENKNTADHNVTDKPDADEALLEATETTETTDMPLAIDDMFVEEVLGQPMYDSTLGGRLGVPGVAVGLAWTAVGGETMIVEASRIPCTRGEGKLELTGQLGSVMKESATLAMSWIRSHATPLGLDGAKIIANHDIHLHFPAGAVLKDGPSAGVTITTALVSLFTERLVRNDMVGYKKDKNLDFFIPKRQTLLLSFDDSHIAGHDWRNLSPWSCTSCRRSEGQGAGRTQNWT